MSFKSLLSYEIPFNYLSELIRFIFANLKSYIHSLKYFSYSF